MQRVSPVCSLAENRYLGSGIRVLALPWKSREHREAIDLASCPYRLLLKMNNLSVSLPNDILGKNRKGAPRSSRFRCRYHLPLKNGLPVRVPA